MGFGGCGGSRHRVDFARHDVTARSGQSSTSNVAIHDKDRDYDGDPKSRYDPDDYYILRYGRPATRAERHAVAGLVRRYYAYAANGDGRRACSLMSSVFSHAIVGDYGAQPVPSRGRETCAIVATRLFKHSRRRLKIDRSSLKIVGVRLGSQLGYALLSFKGMPDRHILLLREASRWKIDAALDDVLV